MQHQIITLETADTVYLETKHPVQVERSLQGSVHSVLGKAVSRTKT